VNPNPRLLPSATVARSALRTQSDARLAELVRAGSEPAFETIVGRYRRSLVRYCARIVGEGDAEEAVQEALLKAHAALLGGDPVRKLAPWLYVVAHNTAVSDLRARSSRPQPAEADYESFAAADSSAEYRQELGEVLAAVRSLPDRQRDAIVMRELEGRSYDEIAARLGSSHGAVRQLLHRARSSVRDRVAALLPLEPLARWALTGGADAAGGASLSGACVLGAKACAALILPATIALVASAPSARPRTTPSRASKPAVAVTYAREAAAGPRSPSPVALAVSRESVIARRVPPASVRHARRFTVGSRSAAPRSAPSHGRTQSQGEPGPSARRGPALARFDELDGSEPLERPVDEEDLHRDVGFHVRLGEERDDVAAGEGLDRLGEALGHDALEVVAHGDDAVGLAAVHDRLLEGGEAAAAHDDDDEIVERVGLGLHRTAAVVLSEDGDDAVGDRRQQLPSGEGS
jgi:RNA polymerase sigma factor (sigma-70 family)